MKIQLLVRFWLTSLGDRLDYWVTGYGTGGTFSGVAKVLRAERPETKIVLSEPANAQLIQSGLKQKRTSDGSPDGSHPCL
jgi:cysteine synthase A